MTTPIRSQYLRIKRQHPGAILLFRLGDFYETFDQDAEIVSRELQIALTSREMGKGDRRPLAGIPFHSLDNYLGKLIKGGYKVAICEQIEDTKNSKGLLDRKVVRVVTPGTVDVDLVLEEGVNNYLVSVIIDGNIAGLAYTDVTTGTHISVTQLPTDSLLEEIDRLNPAEILVSSDESERFGLKTCTTVSKDSFTLEASRQSLLKLLGVITLDGYGCEELPMALQAAGGLIHYLRENQQGLLNSIAGLTTYSTNDFMVLDSQTRRNLELFQGGRWGDASFSLIATLNITKTPMGSRLLRRWLSQPLLDSAEITSRLDVVGWFLSLSTIRQKTFTLLKRISDLERLIDRVRTGRVIPRELVALGISLNAINELRDFFNKTDESNAIDWLVKRLQQSVRCDEIACLITSSINDDPGYLGDGLVIKDGFSGELDEVRQVSRDTKGFIAALESQEISKTGIRNLKIGYNKIFGYYIEVTRSNLGKVPMNYERRQTLTGAERFTTLELRRLEELIANAKESIETIEKALFRQICQRVSEAFSEILEVAHTVAHVDVFASFAEAAERYGYERPQLDNSGVIEIKGGRHPIIEPQLSPGTFVTNDTFLSIDEEQIHIITGPNMSGKSTYLRQVALIILMAQIGSFVPAQLARIGIVDRIFTRVGLQDDLATGRSTFMVEMVETANILNNATKKSFVVLDEIGRGTSTYDGLSIAQAVVEHLHDNSRLGCRTLFATHYHELTKLADTFAKVRNYNVSVIEESGRVVFLHQIIPGGTDKSYGVHVAQLAGLPYEVVTRAKCILEDLENGSGKMPFIKNLLLGNLRGIQPALFPLHKEILEELGRLDVQNMTPIDSINALHSLKEMLEKEKQ